jgi:beta-phosphoglucomutase-like phosphatase (HAD superfamily)
MITHVFFDLAGTLVDSARMQPCYGANLGRVMAERFGGSADGWEQANLTILADWDNYFADLDFDGDDGIADLWEGELRVTRALFRLTHIPEPNKQTLTALSRELPYLVTRHCDALYPDSKPVIEALYQVGYVLGVATHSTSAQARGILDGAGVLDYFRGPLLSPDVTGRFRKDSMFFLAAGVPPERCLVVDAGPGGICGAKAAGMRTVYLCRSGMPMPSLADHTIKGDLCGLLPYLGVVK